MSRRLAVVVVVAALVAAAAAMGQASSVSAPGKEQGQDAPRTFRAAVASYKAVSAASVGDVNRTRAANVAAMERLVAGAAGAGARILLLPEFVVTGGAASVLKSRETLLEAAERVPAAAVNPSADPAAWAASPSVLAMSRAAAAHGIDVAYNMVELAGDGTGAPLVYNTEVVFKAGGEVAASYRKSHPWFKTYDQPAEPDLVTYQADYGPRFGIFTCFDIVFKSPARVLRGEGVTHFLYSVAQGSVGPVLLIKPWTWLNDATLLSSNLGLDVSGIYHHGSSVAGSRTVSVASTGGGGVLVADVPY